jgi:hypothetical protein
VPSNLVDLGMIEPETNTTAGDTPEITNESGNSGENNGASPITKKEKDKRTITLRARTETSAFFDLVEATHERMKQRDQDALQSDAVANVVAALLETADENVKHMEQLRSLEERARIAEEQLAQNSVKQVVPDSLSILTDREVKLLTYIAQRRFADQETRKRYKLEQPESLAELLRNCILSTGILYNANGDFYTGFKGGM